MSPESKPRHWWWGVWLMALIVLCVRLNAPWTGMHDGVGAANGLLARNLVQYGVRVAGLGHLVALDDGRGRPIYYLHHPGGFPLLLAADIRLLGAHEWNLRLLSVIMTALALWLLRRFAVRFWPGEGWLIASVACVLPVVLWYGRLPHMAPVCLAVSLAGLLLGARWMRTQRTGDLLMFGALQILACAINWAGYGVWLAVIIWCLWERRSPGRLWLVGAVLPVMFCAHLMEVWWLGGQSALTDFLDAGLFKVGLTGTYGYATARFSTLQWVGRLVRSGALDLTVPVLLALVGGIIRALWRRLVRAETEDGPFIASLACAAWYFLLFRNDVYVHDFWWLLAVPAASVATGGAWKTLGPTWRVVGLCVCVIQSAWLVSRRHQQRDGAPIEIPFAQALAVSTDPGSRVATPLLFHPYHQWYIVPFYAPDRVVRYAASRPEAGDTYWVTASGPQLREQIPFFRQAGADFLAALGVDRKADPPPRGWVRETGPFRIVRLKW